MPRLYGVLASIVATVSLVMLGLIILGYGASPLPDRGAQYAVCVGGLVLAVRLAREAWRRQ